MKVLCVNACLAISFVMAACLARADLIVENVDQPIGAWYGPIGTDSNSSDFLIGQEITLPASTNLYELDEVSLLLKATNGGGNVTVSIWTVGRNNTPATEIAALSPVFVSEQSEVSFVASSNTMLAPGTYYVVAAPTTPADNGLVYWAVAGYTNWTGSGALGYYADTASGVWSGYPLTDYPQQLSVIATPVVPANLKMYRQGGTLKLSWPSALTGYELDGTTNLPSEDWQTVTNKITIAGGTNLVTNSISGTMRLFRLRQDFVVSNLSQTVGSWDGPIGMGTTANGYLLGDEWTVPSGQCSISNVILSLNPVRGSAHITASIWTVNLTNNVPGSEIDMIATQLVSKAGDVTFAPRLPITLPAGSYYLVAGAATSDDSGKVGWNWTESSSWTGFGILEGYAGTTNGTWQTDTVAEGPYLLSIQAPPSP